MEPTSCYKSGMSQDESEPSTGSEPDPFDTIGREIASLLRATHDSSSRIQAEAEERAAEHLAEADRQAEARVAEAEKQVAEAERQVAEAEQQVAEANQRAAEQVAEAERFRGESTREREEAAAVLRQAEATRAETRAEATALLRTILALLDAADARSSQLVDDIEGSRTELASVRVGLAEFGDTIASADAPTDGTVSRADDSPSPVADADLDESADDEGDSPAVIDLREPEPSAPETPSPSNDRTSGGLGSARSTAESSDRDRVTSAEAQDMDDRVAASVRSAVSRAIDQCLTNPSELPPPPLSR